MTPDRWVVTATGLALIAFIVWFFWLKRSTGFRATETSGGYQEAMILVKGGYTPDTIIVRSGRPVRLNLRREGTASCSESVLHAQWACSAENSLWNRRASMSLHDRSEHEDHPQRSFLSSRAGLVLIGFLIIGGALLFTEHRAHALGVLIWLPLIACPLMHMFMHGGHGGHGSHGNHRQQNRERETS